MKRFFLFVALTVFSLVSAQANEPASASPEGSEQAPVAASGSKLKMSGSDLFVEDRISVQLVSGALFSTGIGPRIKEINYQQNNIRLGWMLNTPSLNHPLSGNFELLLELSGSAIMSSYGDVIIGPTALARYNFVQPDWWAVPYIQLGAGVVYTDAYEDKDQNAIGQAVEFTPQASVGSRFLISQNWSVDAEFMYHHISNASMANRNLGSNALGGFLGVSYFFDKLWQ